MRNVIKTFVLFAFLYVLAGCKSNPTTQVVYTGSAIPGTIGGNGVLLDTLYDNFTQNYSLLPDAENVQVSLEGTNFNAVTDKNGAWKINNVPPGVYNIVYQKDGFATSKSISKEFAGNGIDQVEFFSLYRISKISLELILRSFEDYIRISPPREIYYYDSLGKLQYGVVRDSVFYKNGHATLTLKILDAPANIGRYVTSAIFFSKTDNISPSDGSTFLYSMITYTESNGYYSTGDINFDVIRDDLLKAGFSLGDKIYCTAFAGKNTIRTKYKDPETYRDVYTGFSPHHSEIKSFILP